MSGKLNYLKLLPLLVLLNLSLYGQDQKVVDSLRKVIRKRVSSLEKADAYVQLSEQLGQKHLDSIPFFCNNAIDLIGNKEWLSNRQFSRRAAGILGLAYNNLGYHANYMLDKRKALPFYLKSVELFKKSGDEDAILGALNSLATTYKEVGDFKASLRIYQEVLEKSEKKGDDRSTSMALMGISNLYSSQKVYDEALNYMLRSFELVKKHGLKAEELLAYNGMAKVYWELDDTVNARKYYQDAREMTEKAGNPYHLSTLYNNLGAFYQSIHKPDSALYFLEKAIVISEKVNAPSHNISNLYNNLSRLYNNNEQLDKAIEAGKKAFEAAKKSGDLIDRYQALEALSVAFRHKKDYENAYFTHYEYLRYRDSALSEGNKRALIKREFDLKLREKEMESMIVAEKIKLENTALMQRKELGHFYEQENQKMKMLQDKRELIINENAKRKQMEFDHKREQELAEVVKQKNAVEEKEKARRQRLILISVSLILAFVTVFSVLLYRRFKITERQKAIIDKQKKEVEGQKHLVEEKQQEILDSIRYAKRIQQAHLPSEKYIERKLGKKS